jgi:hypothetical protein
MRWRWCCGVVTVVVTVFGAVLVMWFPHGGEEVLVLVVVGLYLSLLRNTGTSMFVRPFFF